MSRLRIGAAGMPKRGAYALGVERLLKADRAYAIAAATAQSLNDELTVILSSLVASMRVMEPGHPARVPLRHLESAALRCASTASRLVEYGGRRGARACRVGLDVLLED